MDASGFVVNDRYVAMPPMFGTETGKSVPIPASVNGVAALRPTIGRIANRVLPVNTTFDTVGRR